MDDDIKNDLSPEKQDASDDDCASAKETSNADDLLKNDIPGDELIFSDETEIVENETASDETIIKKLKSNCMCFQNNDGKYYCYHLIQGNWVQFSQIPFDSFKECEDASCS